MTSFTGRVVSVVREGDAVRMTVSEDFHPTGWRPKREAVVIMDDFRAVKYGIGRKVRVTVSPR